MDPLYEYYNTGDDDDLGIGDTLWYAQTFTVGTVGPNIAHNIESIKLKLYRVGNPGDITVSIRATLLGEPNGIDLSIGTTDGNTLDVDPAGEWREIAMSAYELQPGFQYAIVIRSGADTHWRREVVATYAGGSVWRSLNSGVAWTEFAAQDGMFEEWGSAVAVGRSFGSIIG